MSALKNHRIKSLGVPGIYAGPATQGGCWKICLTSGKLTVCPRLRKMLEIPSSQQVTLGDVLNLLCPDQLIKLVREYKLANAHGSKLDTQVKIRTPLGKVKWLQVSGVLYYRRWGKAEQMIGLAEDTTQRISEEGLSLAVVNHELRNPLTVIKLNVQLLITMLSAKLEEHPVKILKNVDLHINGMTNVIEEYLTLPVNEHGRTPLNCTVFNLEELIDMMISEMRTQHAGHRFGKQSSGPVWIRADKYKIVQVLINYLTNAVNFSPASSQITVGMVQSEHFVEVAIRDTGIGIPAGQEEQIFQKFYRCDTGSVRQKNSKGLGLYLVKKIIRDHGGSVRAERGSNGGAIFYFSLPLHTTNEYKPAARAGLTMY